MDTSLKRTQRLCSQPDSLIIFTLVNDEGFTIYEWCDFSDILHASFDVIRYGLKVVFPSSSLTHCPQVSGENGHRKGIFSKPLFRVEIFENTGLSFVHSILILFASF